VSFLAYTLFAISQFSTLYYQNFSIMKKSFLFIIACVFCTSNVWAQMQAIPMGTSANSYGGFVENKHTLSYNPDLNLLVFGHRGGGASGGTGNEIHYDYSTDGGNTWTSQIPMTNPVPANLTRYPQMCIWNPAGNTNIANAKVVTTGPTITASAWNGSFLAWADLPAAANTAYTFQDSIPNITPGVIDYASWSLSYLNGGMGYVAGHLTKSAGNQHTTNTVDFWKIVPDGNGGFTRSVKFTSEPVECANALSYNLNFDLAFAPNGNTGYISHTKSDMSSQKAVDYARTPVLYKTTDAGETWVKQNLIDLHAIQMIADSTMPVADGSGAKRPTVTQTSMVVDDAGRCHLFAQISSGISTCTDSIDFFHQAAGSRFVVHFIIDGSTVKTNFVYRNRNTDGPFASVPNSFDAQHQAGRSADGSHIFFTAIQSFYADMNGGTDNMLPDLCVYAYRTTDDMFMPFRNLTLDSDVTGVNFFPRLSPIVRNIANGHALPIVVMEPGIGTFGTLDETLPATFSFTKGIQVLDTDYTGIMSSATVPMYSTNGSLVCSNTPCNAFTTNVCSITASAQIGSNVLCNGGSTGSVVVAASGGTAPYAYVWNNGATTSSLANIPAGVYTATITDAAGCTTTTGVTVTEPTAMVVTYTTQPETCHDQNGVYSIQATGGIAPYRYTLMWATFSTAVFNNLVAGEYNLMVTDANNCTFESDSYVIVGRDNTGCVFPGDANNDGIANNYDLLPIALGSGVTGGTRTPAMHINETSWRGFSQPDFANNTPNTNTNQKFADCNGNGIINQQDISAININYGNTTQPRNTQNTVWHSNAPSISCVFPAGTPNPQPAAVVTANLMIGDAANPATDMTGFAFTINYDATIAESAFIELDNFSWLGAPNELYYLQHDDGQGHLDIAISRFDGTTRNGMGAVATCNFVITDNVIGRDPNNSNRVFNVSVSGIQAINNQNVPKVMNGVETSTIVASVVSTTQTILDDAVRVFPNPLNGNILTVKTDNLKCTNAVLHNVLGQAVFSTTLNNDATHNLTLTDLANGVYTLTLTTEKGNVVRKVIVAR
jgi:SprB repeat/Secretion system C-terminal sorting domain